ncbi:MAG: PQQ-binding-like beta-propeller repeat protein [Treponema sp.]|nr:PQQ-binding-like beta-propeller repeat protein [Treponema sp.]
MRVKNTETRFFQNPSGLLLLFALLLSAPSLPGQEEFGDFPLWRQALGGEILAPPAAQAGSVVMVCDGGNLKAYTWRGIPLWSRHLRGKLLPFITRAREGTSYVCLTGGVLLAVNRAGRELWQISLSENPAWPVLTGWDGRLFVFTEKRIICYTASGFTLWSKSLEKKIALKPSMDVSGGFFLVLEDGEFLRFDPFGASGGLKLDAVPQAAVSLPDGQAAGEGVFLLLYQEAGGRAEILKFPGGQREAPKLPGFSAPPLAAAAWGDETAVLLKDGRAALLSRSREILWTGNSHLSPEDLSASEEAAMFFDERGIYILSRTGASAFTADGRRLWLVRLRGAAAVPAFSDEGVLYSGGKDWILNAYRPEERVRSRPDELYGPAPEGSYGTGRPGPSPWADQLPHLSEDMMRSLLGEINRAIQLGSIGENEKTYAAFLMETAGSRIKNPHAGSHPPVQARYRAEAARLLAYMGSRETIPFLTDLFTRDPDGLVKAAAAEAIGRIGVDPEGSALKAFTDAVFPPFPLRDEAALTAVAAAAGALCRFSGPPLSGAGIRLLTALAVKDQNPPVRLRAEQELRILGRE